MAVDLVIDIENTPGALAEVAAAISDAGVNIAAATCIGAARRAELHILVPHAEAARHALAISHLAVSREREVVVVDVEDRPGVLADLTRRIAKAGVDLDLLYVATRNRVVFGLIVNGGTIPGIHDTHLLTALEAVPGAVAGIAAVYFEGVRRENVARA